MRADRLLSTLLLLQAHGKLTVRELATRLEVSHRTAYRDLEALSAAGVPVLALRGSRGGWQLDEEWRTRVPGQPPPTSPTCFSLHGSSRSIYHPLLLERRLRRGEPGNRHAERRARHVVEPRLAEDFMSWRAAKLIDRADEWITLQAEFEDEEQACFAIMGMSARAEVIEPASLRERVRAGAAAVMARYGAAT